MHAGGAHIAMTKLFVPLCSAQDGESTDVNCLLF